MSFAFRPARVLVLAGALTVLSSFGSASVRANEGSAPQASLAELTATAQREVRSGDIEDVQVDRFDGDVRDLPAVTYPLTNYWQTWNEFPEPHRVAPPSATNKPGPSTPESANAFVASM